MLKKGKGHTDTVSEKTHVFEYSDVNDSGLPALQSSHDYSMASGRSPASLCMHTFVIRASWFPGIPYHSRRPPGLARLPHAHRHVFLYFIEVEFESDRQWA